MGGKEIEILPPGMHDLGDLGIANEFPEYVERAVGLHGGKVDHGSGVRSGDLNQLESRGKGVFTDELGIQRQSWALLQDLAERFKRSLVSHILGRWMGCHVGFIL